MTEQKEAKGTEVDKKAKIKRYYQQYQMLDQQLQQVQKQLQMLDQQITEVNLSENSLQELSTVKEGSEVLVPICPGIFIKANIKDTKTLIMNVGANTLVESNVDNAKKLLTDQVKELRDLEIQLGQDMQMLSMQFNAVEGEMQKLSSEK